MNEGARIANEEAARYSAEKRLMEKLASIEELLRQIVRALENQRNRSPM